MVELFEIALLLFEMISYKRICTKLLMVEQYYYSLTLLKNVLTLAQKHKINLFFSPKMDALVIF